MELYIVSEVQTNILVVTARGLVRFDSVLRLLKQTVDKAAVDQISKILVNCFEVEGELAAFERFRLGSELAEYLAEHQISVKLAFIGSPPVLNGFGMRIARNRGVVANVFPTRQEALLWIHDPPAPDSLTDESP